MKKIISPLLTLLLASSSFALATPANATSDQAVSQIVDNHAFLAGKFVEVGVRPNGSFGSDETPAGFHNQEDGLGFVSIRDTSISSWSAAVAANKRDGDFFVPGSPYEGWAFRVGSSLAFNNDGDVDIPGALTNLQTAPINSVKWTATNPFEGISIEKVYSVPNEGQRLDISVTLTNTTVAPISDIYYGRGVDPDNGALAADDPYVSTNTVAAQYATQGYSLVKAGFPGGAEISLYSTDARSKAAAESGGFNSDFDPKVIWESGLTFKTNVGFSETFDAGMNLAFDIGTLAAGESATFTYSYLLSASVLGGSSSPAPAPAPAPVQPPQLLSLALNLALNATLPSGSTILSGSGLQPNSQYTLTLRSDPVLLFTGTSDPNGNFKSAFDLGSVTCPAPGAHTLTLAGVRPDGSETSAVAAFSIDAGCKVTNIVRDGYGQDALANVYFASGSSKLSKAAKGKIEAAVKANPSAIYRVIGYVQKSGSSSNDEKLSLARARSVEKYLVSLGAGVNFTVVSESGLISPQNGKSVKARKATLFALTPVVL